MKTHQDKFMEMLKTTKYSSKDLRDYWRKHPYKISLQTVTDIISKSGNSKYVGKLCAADLCCDEQLKNDYVLFHLFQFANNDYNKNNLIELLSVCGANPNRFFDEKTALYMAVGNCFPVEAIEILLDYGADPAKGKLWTIGDRFDVNTTFNEAATMAEYNKNYEVIMLLMKKGYNFPSTLCATTNYSLFTEDSSFVGKLNSLYQHPSNFFKLSNDSFIKHSHKENSYLKSAALYGLKREAKQLQESGTLTGAYIEKSTELIKQINQKLEDIAQKQNNLLEEEKAKRDATKRKSAEQNTLFNKLNSVIKQETGETTIETSQKGTKTRTKFDASLETHQKVMDLLDSKQKDK